MSAIDWAVMLGTLLFIVGYGTWKTRGSRNIKSYLKGDNSDRWLTIGLSVMATQASAITFLSTPGQAYVDGMRFIQFYFGLPLAMIIISVVFIPLYFRMKVYTAYEFLESRFDLKTRVLTAFLFLVQRGLAAGITIYAPAIILSQILGWSLGFTCVFIGVLVIIYTVSGGTKAVSQTHKLQMAVIFTGMFIAFGVLLYYLGDYLSFGETLEVAGRMGKLNVIDLEFDPANRYNIWSGLIGGLFLQLSYFGTDQSQVQRYLSGRSIRESRMGLMFNGLLKIPMQFFILFVGVLVFVFYQYNLPPPHFNQQNLDAVAQSDQKEYLQWQYENNEVVWGQKKEQLQLMIEAIRSGDERQAAVHEAKALQLQQMDLHLRERTREYIALVNPDAETEDSDYIFISWVMNFLPIGLIGLLLAVIFSAAMSSTSAELNALGSTATIDMYKRNFKREGTDRHYLLASKWMTLAFGLLAIVFALLASLFDNLIEAVNILGSLFYGVILGVFLVAFFVKWVKGRAVFIAAIISEVVIITLYVLNRMEVIEIAYLWYNLIGPALVIVLSIALQSLVRKR